MIVFLMPINQPYRPVQDRVKPVEAEYRFLCGPDGVLWNGKNAG
jgi:hypothetical protein